MTLPTMLLVLVTAMPLPVTAVEPAQLPPGGSFIDDDGSEHEGSIEAIAAAGITLGCNPPDNDRYCPDTPVSRAQMATFLTRALHLPASADDRFTDDDTNIHRADIQSLAAAGITLGCNPPDNDRYCPDTPVSRAQMATFLTRALGLTPMVPPVGYFARVGVIDSGLAARMATSWRPGCPVALADLRHVELDHWGFDGRERLGELVVHAESADDIVAVFQVLFEQRFPIERLTLVDDYGGDDLASMDANNTSAFNCRLAQGSSLWSEHAYGRAIDINPVQNPYVSGALVLPPAGRAHLDRTVRSAGMVLADGVVVDAFAAIGWGWGGDWVNSKDYQHFSSTGR